MSDGELRACVHQALALGLSQRDIATRLGVSQPTVWRVLHPEAVEAAKARPPKVVAACRVCGGPVSSARWRRCQDCARAALSRRITGTRRRGRPPKSPNDPLERTEHIEAELARQEAYVRKAKLFTLDPWQCRWGQYGD